MQKMSKYKQQTVTRLTFAQLLIVIIILSLLTIVASVILLIGRNRSNPQTIEQTVQKVKIVLLETQEKAERDKQSYVLMFKNSPKGVKYSKLIQGSSPVKWEKLSNNSDIKVRESDIVFNSNGSLESHTNKLSFYDKNQNECLIFESNLKNISKEEGTKCEGL